MSVKPIRPDLRAFPDTCGVWHLQGCTDQGRDWLAAEGSDTTQTMVVLDEDIPELADEASRRDWLLSCLSMDRR